MKEKMKTGLPLLFMAVVVLTMITSLFAAVGSANAAISSPVLKYELTGQNVNLTWASVPNATSYNVFYSQDNSTYSLLGNTTNTYFTHTQPWNSTYYYYIVALNATNTSAQSNIVNVTTPKSSGGAGWLATAMAVPIYMPFAWLGIFLIFVGLILVGYGKTSRRRRSYEGLGALSVVFGFFILLASVVLPYFHLI